MTKPLVGFAEAIFVLANLMDRDGRLNEDSLARLELAASLMKQRPQSCMITSGWNYRPDSQIMIAHAMRDRARDGYGIAGPLIFANTLARDTVGDVFFVKRDLIELSDIRRLTIVSSDYHIHRVQQIFEFVFGRSCDLHFVSTPVEHRKKLESSEAASLAAFRSTFEGVPIGDTDAIFQRLVRAHPRYNGVEYPAL